MCTFVVKKNKKKNFITLKKNPFEIHTTFKISKMASMPTLRCPCVHSNNYAAALRALKNVTEFDDAQVRFSENMQKPNHWAIYIDVIHFKDAKFESEFNELVLKECLKLYLPNGAYVMVGIGKNQDQCDAEEAAKAQGPEAAKPQGPEAAKPQGPENAQGAEEIMFGI